MTSLEHKTLGEVVAYDLYKALWTTGNRPIGEVGLAVLRAMERLGWTVYPKDGGGLSCYRGMTRALVEFAHRSPNLEQVLRLARELCEARVIVLRSPVVQLPMELQGNVWTVGLAVKP